MLAIMLSVGIYNQIQAQNVTVNVNVNSQPSWGPSGYDYAGYYYFPDLNIYFDVNNSLFYYLSGSNWISNQYLPDKYRQYDLYSLYKVVINDSKPWSNNKTHKKSYSGYKKDKTQTSIRYSNDSKYSTSKQNNRAWVNTSANSSNNKGNNNSNSNSKGNNTNSGNNKANNSNSNNNKGTQNNKANGGKTQNR